MRSLKGLSSGMGLNTVSLVTLLQVWKRTTSMTFKVSRRFFIGDKYTHNLAFYIKNV